MRIATRASTLALTQAGQVAEALGGGELVALATAGDEVAREGALPGVAADGPSDKARWVTELERALLAGEVDLAVHSAKDVPAEIPPGLTLAGSPARSAAADALCGAPSLDALPVGARVGTSSLRRAALLRAQRPDLEIVALRGNVDTRLAKLDRGECDALVLALAGLRRLGREDEATAVLDPRVFVPAAGQGTLALQARAGDAATIRRVRAIADPETERCLAAERALVRALDADCDTPIGAHARSDGATLTLTVFVGRDDGSTWLRDEYSGADPAALAGLVARRLTAAGANSVLGR